MDNQISMFEMLNAESLLPEDRQKFRRALHKGSGFVEGKERITKKAKELSKSEFVEFLKKEYGIGGFSFEEGFVDYASKRFCIYEKGWETKQEHSWTEVANEILDMLSTNSY